MPQDPYAAIAKPVDDPYATIAKPTSDPYGNMPTAAPQKGFLGSAADASGLTSLGRFISHPLDSIKAIPSAIESGVHGAVNEAHDEVNALRANGFTQETRRKLGGDIPIIGPALKTAQEQHDAGNDAGMAGTLAGTVAGFAGPEAAGKALSVAGKGIGAGLRVASADAPSLSLAATRALTTGTPGELLQSALKPGVKYGANVSSSLEKALPDVIAASPTLKGVSGFASAADAAKDASFEPYNDLIAPYRSLNGAQGPVRPSAINGSPIADAQMRSIPAMDLIEKPAVFQEGNPGHMKIVSVPAGEGTKLTMGGVVGATPAELKGGIVNKTAAIADNYRRPLSVPALDDVRQDANGKLNAFYNKAGGDQAAALSNPETARVKAVGDSTRNILYPQLEKDAALPAGTVSDMQGKYGLLSDISDIANKREPVFARHDPVTLSQKIVSGHGNPLSMAWNYAVQKGLGNLTDSDALVNSAIDRFQNPDGTPLVARPGFIPQNAMKLGKFLGGK